MRQSSSPEQQLRLERERCVQYRGTARVRLEVLQFHDQRQLSQKNVDKLKNVFDIDAVRRLEPRNHIPALVQQGDLELAMRSCDITPENLLTNEEATLPPLLTFPPGFQLTFLHGLHRIQAARETLAPTDAWWTVDLYLADTDPELRTVLVEEYSNEEKPSDGEIYCKIRRYERQRNLCFKNRWKARLTDHGRRGLRQLDDHENLAAAFDDVLEISGMWYGMRLSTIHKISGSQCYEESLHYLEHIRDSFSQLMRPLLPRDNAIVRATALQAALQKVDEKTVRALELKAPGYSKQDAQILRGQLLSGQIFAAFGQQEREAIWTELSSFEWLIPTLHSYFEDFKYLESCSNCVKRLVSLPRGKTLFGVLKNKFPNVDHTSNVTLEIAESSFTVKEGRNIDRFDLARRQVWLFAMRHYQELPPDLKKKDTDLLAKAGPEKADESILYEYAVLADKVGFASKEILDIKNKPSDEQIARNALLKARKPDRFQYDDAELEEHIKLMVRMFSTASPHMIEHERPALVSGNPNAVGNRCGFPTKDTYTRDKHYLFLENLHEQREEQGEEITSFFVRRSVYFAFFGDSVDLSRDGTWSPFNQTSVPQESEIHITEAPERDTPTQQQERPAREEQDQRERLERERLDRERIDRERREEEKSEQERRQRETAEEQRRQESLRLRRLEDEIERNDVQERLARDLQQQEDAAAMDRLQLERERREREREIEERRRKDIREQQRQEEERALKHSERARKAHTQVYVEDAVLNSIPGTATAAADPVDEDTGEEIGVTALQLAATGRQGSTSPPQDLPGHVRITYWILERESWRISDSLDVDLIDSSEVERLAVKYMRKRIRLFDTDFNILKPMECFAAAVANGQNAILLIPEGEIDINEELEASIPGLVSQENLSMRQGPTKRSRS